MRAITKRDVPLARGRSLSSGIAGGDIVLLEEQDRTLWDKGQIAEGLALVEESLRMPGRPESYAVQAAIAALHARALTPQVRRTVAPARFLVRR